MHGQAGQRRRGRDDARRGLGEEAAAARRPAVRKFAATLAAHAGGIQAVGRDQSFELARNAGDHVDVRRKQLRLRGAAESARDHRHVEEEHGAVAPVAGRAVEKDAGGGDVAAREPDREPALHVRGPRGQRRRGAGRARAPRKPLQVVAGDLRIHVRGGTGGVERARDGARVLAAAQLRGSVEQPGGDARVRGRHRRRRGRRQERGGHHAATASTSAASRTSMMRAAAAPSPNGASLVERQRQGRRRREQRERLGDDDVAVHRHEANVPALHAFRAFGARARHQQRHAQVRHLFLDAAGIADDQRRTGGRRDELAIVHRRHQRELRMPAKPLADPRRDARIRMHGHQQAQVRTRRAERDQRIADDVGLAVPVLAPVQRDQHLVARRMRTRRQQRVMRQGGDAGCRCPCCRRCGRARPACLPRAGSSAPTRTARSGNPRAVRCGAGTTPRERDRPPSAPGGRPRRARPEIPCAPLRARPRRR